jgi:hypothetical protein
MNYSELLHDFVDGTTDANQEQSLFMALASHDELRTDLKQLLAIKSAVQNDSKAFVPPVESTLALFSTLGFAAPIMPTSLPKAGIAPRAAQFFGNSSKAILTGLVMSSLTAVVMFLWMNNHTENHNGNFAEKTPIASSAIAGISASTTQNTFTQTTKTITLPPKEIIKYVYITDHEKQESSKAIQAETSITSSVETDEQLSSPILYANYQSSNSSQNRVANGTRWKQVEYDAEQLPSPIDMPSPSTPSRWTLELRRIDTRSSVAPTFFTSTPILNNLAITALYSLNSEFSAGIEIAEEQSFQRFTGKDNAGRTLLYEQNPVLPSVAATIRYTPIEWGKFQPIIQASVGGTEVGAFGRGLVGVQYYPETFLSFMFGAEANILRYSHQNTAFTSSKYGLSYGVSFHF